MTFTSVSLASEIHSFPLSQPSVRPAQLPAVEFPPSTEARPVVHLIHGDEPAARDMAGSWEWLGARTRIHPDAAAFARAGPTQVPSCLVVHVRLARDEGLELFASRPAPSAGLPMIVTTDQADVRTVVLAMKAGAVDFFETPVCQLDLGEAVQNAIRADWARREREAHRSSLLERFGRLTRREREVMALVTQGLLNKQVAGDLGLSEVTVKVHRGSVMRKMAARSIADLVRMADAIAGCATAGLIPSEAPV